MDETTRKQVEAAATACNKWGTDEILGALLQAQALNRIADALEGLQAPSVAMEAPRGKYHLPEYPDLLADGAAGAPEAPQAPQDGPQHPSSPLQPSWITQRCPTAADARPDSRSVIIPVGNGTTVATIDWNLVVEGQPWAPAGSNPGPWPF